MIQREYHMKVFTRQQLGLACQQPFCLCDRTARRTMSIAAGVVTHLGVPACIAFIRMPTQRFSSASFDAPHGFGLFASQFVCAAICITIATKNIRQCMLDFVGSARYHDPWSRLALPPLSLPLSQGSCAIYFAQRLFHLRPSLSIICLRYVRKGVKCKPCCADEEQQQTDPTTMQT